jgi:hypothetical protein
VCCCGQSGRVSLLLLSARVPLSAQTDEIHSPEQFPSLCRSPASRTPSRATRRYERRLGTARSCPSMSGTHPSRVVVVRVMGLSLAQIAHGNALTETARRSWSTTARTTCPCMSRQPTSATSSASSRTRRNPHGTREQTSTSARELELVTELMRA